MDKFLEVIRKLGLDGIAYLVTGGVALLVSIVSALPSNIVNKDNLPTVILGIMGVVLFALAGLSYRQNVSEAHVRTALKNTRVQLLDATHLSAVMSDTRFAELIGELAQSYAKIKRYAFDEYTEIALSSLRDCGSRFHEIASGEVRLAPAQVQEYGFVLFRQCKSAKAIHLDDMDYWRRDFGRRHFAANLEALQKGAKITRIFALTDEEAHKNVAILREHEQAGIKVVILPPEKVPEDFLIFDDRILIRYDKKERLTTKDEHQNPKTEYLILDDYKVKKAKEDFARLEGHPYARTIDQALGSDEGKETLSPRSS